jgi:adenylate cyclase
MASVSPTLEQRTATPAPEPDTTHISPPLGWRRIFAPITHRVGGKIISPYLVLVFILAIFATYVVMNLVTTSLEEKFRSQLADSGRAANESMVNIESDHLKVFRQMAFTEGVAENLQASQSDQLLTLLAPIMVNAHVDFVDVLDAKGNVVVVLRPQDRAAEAAQLVDKNAAQWPPVRKVLDREDDQLGDKFSAIVEAPWGRVLYTAGPVKLDGERVGVIAVGTPLDKVVARLSQDAIAGVTLYNPDGGVVASTLPGAVGALRVDPNLYQQIATVEDEVQQRTIGLGASRYYEILGMLEVRRAPVLLMGVSQSISLIMDKGAQTRNQMIALFATVTLLVLLTGLLLARKLLRPIRLLVEACKAMAAGDISREVPVVSSDETGLLTVTFNQSLQGLRERDAAKDAFGRYMSPELYEAIKHGELKLGGEKRLITTLLSDIRSFTTLSEGMDPHDLVSLLNRYFETQVAAIQRYGGTVDKFMGDAILAKFGAPVWYPDHASRAVLAMVEMRQALEAFNRELVAQGRTPIQIGIGANTGEAVVGNIGSTARMEYTIIGDTVNATQRIEDLCKELKWDLLIGDTTYELGKDVVEVGEPYRITLRGRQRETLVYPVLGLKSGAALQEEAEAIAAHRGETVAPSLAGGDGIGS